MIDIQRLCVWIHPQNETMTRPRGDRVGRKSRRQHGEVPHRHATEREEPCNMTGDGMAQKVGECKALACG
ncbi:hypothetical protein CaCOL14_000921 [Colletotrichum acutatum]